MQQTSRQQPPSPSATPKSRTPSSSAIPPFHSDSELSPFILLNDSDKACIFTYQATLKSLEGIGYTVIPDGSKVWTSLARLRMELSVRGEDPNLPVFTRRQFLQKNLKERLLLMTNSPKFVEGCMVSNVGLLRISIASAVQEVKRLLERAFGG